MKTRLYLSPQQIFDDRTVGPLIAVAAFGQVDQGGEYGLKIAYALFHFRDMLEGKAFDIGAGPVLVAPQGKKTADILYRKTKMARPLDKTQYFDVVLAVISIAVISPGRWLNQADAFVIADGLCRDS